VPGAYSAATVAQAFVQAAARPGRDGTVGGSMLLAEPLFRLLRPLADAALGAAVRYAVGRGRRPAGRGASWEPSGDGSADAGMGGRPSVVVLARSVRR
jgi:hypothetical protein